MQRSDTPDAELLGRARARDPDSFGVFYARHCEPVLGFLARRVASPEVAADLMAETFASALVVVLDSERRLPDTPVAWLFTIARNLLIDSARRGQVEVTARRRLGLEPLVLEDRDLERIAEISEAQDCCRACARWSRPPNGTRSAHG